MEGNNNQNENSSQIVQPLPLPPTPHHTDSETNLQNNNNSVEGNIPSSNRRPRGRPPGSKNKPKPQINNSLGGGNTSSDRRPRGRPSISKNKPKHQTITYHESPNANEARVLEVSTGADLIETLNNYAIQRGRGVRILYGKGKVSNIIIRRHASSSSSEGVITLPGAFEIISITGTVFPPPALPGSGGLSIFISGGHGKLLGGNVVGPLIATGAVILTVASFANALFERILVEDNETAEREDADNDVNLSLSEDFLKGDGGNAAPRAPF